MKLNLGCSDDLRPGYVNVDRVAPADELVDLGNPWPWETSSVDRILARDVFEHIDWPDGGYAGNRGKIFVMNESWRVLKPGGLLDLAVPCVQLSDGRVNPGAFADPTHVSFWTEDDKYYFCEAWNNPTGERGRLGPAYGIQALFRVVRWEVQDYGEGRERRAKIFALLEAVK